MKVEASIPLLGIAARSGTGKTTLLKQVLPLLKASGIRVGMIKHSHHDIEVDKPGKDSYELRKAGAEQMLLSSPYRWVLVAELDDRKEPELQTMVNTLHQDRLDMILVEGFKHETFSKIELHRAELGNGFLFLTDPDIIAIASDTPAAIDTDIKVLPLNSPADIVEFIKQYIAS